MSKHACWEEKRRGNICADGHAADLTASACRDKLDVLSYVEMPVEMEVRDDTQTHTRVGEEETNK